VIHFKLDNFRKDIGLTYTRYSAVAAAALRQCLKSSAAAAGQKLPERLQLKVTYWESGKAKKPE
jgi:hypothetical protein